MEDYNKPKPYNVYKETAIFLCILLVFSLFAVILTAWEADNSMLNAQLIKKSMHYYVRKEILNNKGELEIPSFMHNDHLEEIIRDCKPTTIKIIELGE